MPKLLLVEDDNNLREIYQARLQAEGYSIVVAKDGEEALVVAKAETPDLVVSDVMMPKISGFEMLDILRNTDGLKDVKVIMLTALGQSDDQARADKLGADRYLVKSQVTLEDIVKATHELLQESGAEEAPVEDTPEPAMEAPVAPPAAQEPQAITPEPIAVAAPPALEPAITAVTPEPAPITPAPAPEPAVAPIVESAPAVEVPVAVTPMPEPVVEAQSSSEEEASVEANIESFVAGASSEATAPMPTAPAMIPEPAMEAPVAPPAAQEPVTTTTGDQIIADAVDSINQATAPATVEAPTAPVSPAFVEASTAIAPSVSNSAPVGGVRVIEPTEGEPKKDINDLLAIEEAKEAAQSQAPAPQQPLQAPAEPTPLAPQEDGNHIDPNSIAL